MSTSNLPTAIGTSLRSITSYEFISCCGHYVDSAFVDRADIVQYVDLPPREAIYEILRGCLVELVKKGIVAEAVSSATFSLVRNLLADMPLLGCSKSCSSADI